MGASAFVAPAPKQMRSRGMARMAVDDLIGREGEGKGEKERRREKKRREGRERDRGEKGGPAWQCMT